MNSEKHYILTINGGSSSIRFALYEASDLLPVAMRGKVDRVGQRDSTFRLNDMEHRLGTH